MAEKGKKKRMKKWLAVTLAVVFSIAFILGFLQLGAVYSMHAWEYWRPDYDKTDILPILEKRELSEEDYKVLYAQTGLTKLGIDDLLSEGKAGRILQIQELYFKPFTVENDCFAPFTYMAEIDWNALLTTLKDGDILISATTFTSWFRYGHSALVVDGADKLVVESVSPGERSELASALEFTDRASFMVLRAKAEETLRREVAKYARENLVNLPYRLTMGIFFKKFKQTPTASHCSHLVWYAYKKYGIDLDSTGGSVVTPRDIARSLNLELVQTFGFNPEKLWG